MKKIKSKNFIQLTADLIEHPPVNEEKDTKLKKDKKKKKIYQLNIDVDDVSIEDLR